MLIYKYVYRKPTYLCTVDQTFNNVWLKWFKTTAQCPKERKHTAARVQHCNSRDWHSQQLLWIFHGSGALPNQGHLQATPVNNRQRTWSQNTGGFSTKHTTHLHTTMAAPADDEVAALAATHKLKLKPPTYDGNYATYEEWKYKFAAYMGLQDPFYPRMFRLAEAAARPVTEAHLRQAATTLEEADAWVQPDQNLKYVLINVTTGAAATLCRQHQHEIGLEVLRQLNMRWFALPVGTRSIGYLTKLLKPTFDSNNFEESFSNWEFEVNRYERDNNTQLPDQVKIAVLMKKQKDHYNNTFTWWLEQPSWNTTGQLQHSAGSSRAHHPVLQQTTMEELHWWT